MTFQLLATLGPGLAFAAATVEPKLTLTAEERYDDDALLRRAEPGLGAELMTKLTPQIGLELRDRTFEAEGSYSPDFQFRHLSRSFQIDHRGALDLSKRLWERGGVRARLNLWRVSDPTSLPRMGMGRSLDPVLYGNGELGFDSMITRRLLLEGRYRFEGALFFDGETPPGVVQAPSLEIWYRLTRRASAGIEYRFQHFLFGREEGAAQTPAALFRYRLGPFTTATARAGPIWYRDSNAAAGIAPRVHLELGRNARGLELGAQAGQDLAGASGYTLALWTQYAGGYTTWRLNEPLRIFGGAYAFRNGGAPGDVAAWLGPVSEYGYAVGGGVEWRFHRMLMAQAELQRVATVGRRMVDGRVEPFEFARNIAALRLVATAW